VTQITIPLKDVLTDPQDPIDLSTLPADEAVQHLKDIYSFLPEGFDITITGGTVTISIPHKDDYPAAQAAQTYKRAVRSAERGKYQAAVRAFQDVLNVLPAHIDARRNLAMACMESGDRSAARQHLVELLRLKPDDAWAWLILGNVYMQFDDDTAAAGRFYARAHQLNPDDVFLLNSYGALKVLFRQAIEREPAHPNPRYGLALSYHTEGQPERALAALEELFAQPRSQDPRSEAVYEQARALYVEANYRLAQDRHAEAMERLKDAMDAHAAQTGYPIELEQDDALTVAATTRLAWQYRESHHLIRYKSPEPAIIAHLIAHEFEHIQLAYEAREAGRGKLFGGTERVSEYAARESGGSRRELRRRGFDEDAIADFIEQITTGLASQLFNIPLDMLIEQRLYQRLPFLRPSQVVSLHATQLEGAQPLTDDSLARIVPPRLYQCNLAMNCAYALFTDDLLSGATAYAAPYRKSHVFSTGRRLFQAWQKRVARFRPGDEYDLVDEFAGSWTCGTGTNGARGTAGPAGPAPRPCRASPGRPTPNSWRKKTRRW